MFRQMHGSIGRYSYEAVWAVFYCCVRCAFNSIRLIHSFLLRSLLHITRRKIRVGKGDLGDSLDLHHVFCLL